MGCDWYITVQGLFKDRDGTTKRWVTLNRGGHYFKTGCGGNPVRFIFRKFIEEQHINGNSGEEFPVVSDPVDKSYYDEPWCVELHKEELEHLDKTYDKDGEVISKKQKTSKQEQATNKKKEKYLEAEEVLKKRRELIHEIQAVRERVKERGLIGDYPEWQYFHFSISEFQGICDALLEGQYTSEYYYDEFYHHAGMD